MIDKEILKAVITEQAADVELIDKEIQRSILEKVRDYLSTTHVIVIQGVRRSGKSTLLLQIRQHFYQGKGYYLSFDDERLLSFTVEDFNLLYTAFIELYGEQKIFFLDEIQNILQWEVFVRRMQDQGHKFILTGSNAAMLSKELGTRLTGRHLLIETYPFSFQEYLLCQQELSDGEKIILNRDNHAYLSTKNQALLQKNFNVYLDKGGFPEYLRFNFVQILNRIYADILYRDIVVRHEVSAVKELRELGLYLFSNIGTLISYNKLKGMLNLGSVNTVKKFIQFFEDCYIFFTVTRFTYSVQQQTLANKKIYCVDNGLVNQLSFKFSENIGHKLENLVFIELKRRGYEIFYYKTKNDLEVDFLIRTHAQVIMLMQVSKSLTDTKTRQRESRSLFAAMEELKINEALILTLDKSDTIHAEDKIIKIMPVYKWILLGE